MNVKDHLFTLDRKFKNVENNISTYRGSHSVDIGVDIDRYRHI